MGMFDTVVVEKDNALGIEPGSYQTKDFDCELHAITLRKDGRLLIGTETYSGSDAQDIQHGEYSYNGVEIYAFYTDIYPDPNVTRSPKPSKGWIVYEIDIVNSVVVAARRVTFRKD